MVGFLPLLALLGQQMNPLDNLPAPAVQLPGRNNVAWVGSPHFNVRPPGTKIDTIVLHHTASSNIEGVIKWFNMPESQVSAHYTVGKDGSIVQHVSTYHRAWHAGRSVDKRGIENVNNYSVGIEIVNKGDGSEPYPPEQVEAVFRLCRTLMRYRHKEVVQIVSHEFIAVPPGRKNDPINYPWESLDPLIEEFKVTLSIGQNPAMKSGQ